MQTKRILVIAISLIIGIVLTVGIIFVGFATTPEKFAYSNVLLLVLSLGGIAFIWLDYLLGTQFLKR